MKLSVILPIYNTSEYLEACLKSIIVDDPNIEYILINDGSTDDSLSICNKYLNKNVRLYNNKNHGVSYTRNFGIQKAKGEWIMFVDSDDLLVPNWDKIINKYYNNTSDLLLFSSNLTENIKNNKKLLLQMCIGYRKNNCNFSGPGSKLYRRSFLIENNILFNEKIINGEDMLFNSICIIKCKNIIAFKESIYRYRININSSTKKWNEKYISSDELFRKKLYKNLHMCNLFSENEILKIESFIDTNAKIGILQRLAYSRNYKIFKKYLKVISKNRFKQNNNIGLKKFLIKFLFDLKLYSLIYILYVIKLNNLRKVNNYFVDL